MKRKNIHPYLSPELYAQFKAYCKRINATESSVIGSALKEDFDDSTDMKLLLRRLDRLGRHATRLERDINANGGSVRCFCAALVCPYPEYR